MIYKGKLLNQYSDSYFKNIKVLYGDDSYNRMASTLLAVLRYISLTHSDKKGSKLPLSIFNGERGGNSDKMPAVIDGEIYGGLWVNIIPDPSKIEAAASNFKSSDGWVCLNDTRRRVPDCIATMLYRDATVRVYVHPDKYLVAIHMVDFSPSAATAIAALLRHMLPWVYPSTKTTDLGNDLELYKALYETLKDDEKSVKVTEILDAVYTAHGIYDIGIKSSLRTYSLSSIESQIANCMSLARNYNERIQYLQDEIQQRIKSLTENDIVLQGLIATKMNKTGDDELYNFFKSHKQIEIEQIETSKIRYSITDYLEYYDEDEVKMLFKKSSSHLRYYGDSFTLGVIWGIFVKHIGKLRVKGAFDLSSSNELRGRTKYNEEIEACNTVLPHPHLYFHECLGDNSRYINDALRTGDIESAVEQTIAVVKNINFTDTTVIEEFQGQLRSLKNKQCIVLEDGTEMTIKEFYEQYCTDWEKELTNG